jgi:hypothetical protein
MEKFLSVLAKVAYVVGYTIGMSIMIVKRLFAL